MDSLKNASSNHTGDTSMFHPLIAALLATTCLTLAPAAHADDDPGTGQEVCGAYNLGVPARDIFKTCGLGRFRRLPFRL
ncbi:hypothetical protein, partial [Mycobacterium paraffinicum]|uniref:hypothetical protein n=1 Tax=Mycobacterium paraffinicum TaxID=53378 RepID=UPI0031E9CB9C